MHRASKGRKGRNTDQHFYRAVELPVISDEEAETLPIEIKQQYAALILQAITAEGLASLWAGKLTDSGVRMMWRWFNLDAQGRQELADEQRESWERIVDIEARSTNRRAQSGEGHNLHCSDYGLRTESPSAHTTPHTPPRSGKTRLTGYLFREVGMDSRNWN